MQVSKALTTVDIAESIGETIPMFRREPILSPLSRQVRVPVPIWEHRLGGGRNAGLLHWPRAEEAPHLLHR